MIKCNNILLAIFFAACFSLASNDCNEIDWSNAYCDSSSTTSINGKDTIPAVKFSCKTIKWKISDSNPEYLIKVKRSCYLRNDEYKIQLKRFIDTQECIQRKPLKKLGIFVAPQRQDLITNACHMTLCYSIPFFSSCANDPIQSVIINNGDSIREIEFGIAANCRKNSDSEMAYNISAKVNYRGGEFKLANEKTEVKIIGNYTRFYRSESLNITPNKLFPQVSIEEFMKEVKKMNKPDTGSEK